MKIVIFGYGQVGQSLEKYFSSKCIVSINKDRVDDLLYDDKLYRVLLKQFWDAEDHDIIFINTVAISNTRYCEVHWEESYKVNVEFPIQLAQTLNYFDSKVPLFHVSTGCIFDGNKAPKFENDPPTPLIAYSRQKLMAETIRHLHDETVIIRPRMIFSPLSIKSNLLRKIFSFYEFINEQNSMTSVDLICRFFDVAIKEHLFGTFNLCHKGTISPFGVKREISNIWGWGNPILWIDKKNLHKKLELNLTDTLIDSSKAGEYVELGDIKEEIIKTIKECKWMQK